MLFLVSVVLVLAFALLGTALLRPPARPAALLSVYLLSYADIVLVGEIANTFYRLNDPVMFLGLQVLLALGALAAWWAAGCPSLRASWVGEQGKVIPAGWRASLKAWPDVWILGVGAALIFLLNAALIWVTAPNNNDSLATHMSRVGYWLQHGSFFPWPSPRVWQITYPVNMQLQMFWTVLFLGSDRLVESIQWLGALAAMTAVYGLARLLGASRPQAFFAAFLWTTFPEIILEATTTQNDLVAGTLFVATVYLLFLGLFSSQPGGLVAGKLRSTVATRPNSHAGMLALSGLGLGLAMGTKQTLFFLLPGLALTLLLILIYCGRQFWPVLLRWGFYSLAAFLLVGIYMFVVNQYSFGHPMGPETAVSAQTGGQNQQSLRDNLIYNSFRLAYQMIDPTGLPDPLTGYGFKAKGRVVGKIVDWIGFRVEDSIAVATGHRFQLSQRYVLSEDAAWYGPLFAFLVIPALFYHLVIGLRRRDPLRVGVFILALTFLIINAVLRPGWDPFQGRYFIPVVTLAAPLVAFLARPGRRWLALRVLIAALAITIAANTFLWSSAKPVTGESTVWNTGRVDQITLQSFYMREPLTFVERYIPADATVGLLNYGVYLEYPFFRENFSRQLVQVYPENRLHDAQWIKAQGIEWLLMQVPDGMPVPVLPDGLLLTAQQGEWLLFAWSR